MLFIALPLTMIVYVPELQYNSPCSFSCIHNSYTVCEGRKKPGNEPNNSTICSCMHGHDQADVL